jgi:hypothetical protein
VLADVFGVKGGDAFCRKAQSPQLCRHGGKAVFASGKIDDEDVHGARMSENITSLTRKRRRFRQ